MSALFGVFFVEYLSSLVGLFSVRSRYYCLGKLSLSVDRHITLFLLPLCFSMIVGYQAVKWIDSYSRYVYYPHVCL